MARVPSIRERVHQPFFDSLLSTLDSLLSTPEARLRALGCSDPKAVIALPLTEPLRARWEALAAFEESNLPT